jgi:hypothetical protein
MMDAMGAALPPVIRERKKSDYMEVARHRVDPARCVDAIRSSGVVLPGVDYGQLFARADPDPRAIPLYFLVNLTRLHVFARRAQ